MKQPLLSIIIPAYNTADTIGRMVNRVLTQQMHDLELILVDDGSTDETPNVLRKLSKTDARVSVITQENGGPSAARNTGLKAARGKFVLLLDSDDDIDPTMIKTMLDKQKSTNADLVTCAIKEIYPDGRIYIPDITPRIIYANQQDMVLFALDSLGKESSVVYNPSNRIFRNSIIRKNHLTYREDLRFGEDMIFNLDYLMHAKIVAVMSQPFYYYYHGTSTSVFSKSALEYKYRTENARLLWHFAATSNSPEAHDLAIWVQTRWFLSYCRIVCESSFSSAKKKEAIAFACRHEKFKPINARKSLNKKKTLIIHATQTLIKHPLLFYFIITIASRYLRKTRRKNLQST